MGSSSQAWAQAFLGWAHPYNFKRHVYHHPQPPSKCIGFSEICQEVYLHKSKINLLRQQQGPGILWDINLTEKGYQMRTDRKKDLDMYYNDHLKLHIMRRLMLVKSWSEIKGIQSAVFEALDREDKVEQAEQEAFQAWKKTGGAPKGPILSEEN